eukprot:15296332-Alexandrium_andersonii.AAC.1
MPGRGTGPQRLCGLRPPLRESQEEALEEATSIAVDQCWRSLRRLSLMRSQRTFSRHALL